MLLSPVLQDVEQGFDRLELTRALRAALREASHSRARAGAGTISAVFIDAEELPAAIRPSGTYRLEGRRVIVRLVLVRDGTSLGSFEIEGGETDVDALALSAAEEILVRVNERR
jgi:hypothetical protein